MTLLIDVGNTRIKWGIVADGKIRLGEPFLTRNGTSAAEFDRVWGPLPPPPGVIASHVANRAVGDSLSRWVAANWGVEVHFVRSLSAGFGVVNGYRRPETLGVDRWACLVAAKHGYSPPLLVVDCGTAVTVDLLDAAGIHHGGLIVPGLELMRRSLTEKAEALRSSNSGEEAEETFGGSTASAMRLGLVRSVASLIQDSLQRAEVLLRAEIGLLLTGGDAPRIAAAVSTPFEIVPDLVLQGLYVISRQYA